MEIQQLVVRGSQTLERQELTVAMLAAQNEQIEGLCQRIEESREAQEKFRELLAGF